MYITFQEQYSNSRFVENIQGLTTCQMFHWHIERLEDMIHFSAKVGENASL